MAHVGVSWRVCGQQEAIDDSEQLQVRGGPQHLLDDPHEGATHVLGDGSQMLVLLRGMDRVGPKGNSVTCSLDSSLALMEDVPNMLGI